MDTITDIRKIIYEAHDVTCNQKYSDNLPYSFHLKCVENQGYKFLKLIDKQDVCNVTIALICHDTIEDARMTYNDLKSILDFFVDKYQNQENNFLDDFPVPYDNSNISKFKSLEHHINTTKIADIVYCVTDEKGKNRKERKNQKYYSDLKNNELAVFVKLADIAANKLYSKLTGSDMYDQYRKEFPKFKEKLYIDKYKEFFDYVENI